MLIDELREKPIVHAPLPATPERIAELQAAEAAVELFEKVGVQLDHAYHRTSLGGSHPRVFTRQAIATRLDAVVRRLGPRYGLRLFDVFRSKEAQAALFERVRGELRATRPKWDEDELARETGKFVADPYQPRTDPLPHNTGGAVDLTLTDGGKPAAMGTGFDEPVEASATLYFEQAFTPDRGFTAEQWQQVRGNRRILFHVMQDVGFSNYRDEWWHYDLGNGMWGRACGVPWVFDSMEDAVRKMLK